MKFITLLFVSYVFVSCSVDAPKKTSIDSKLESVIQAESNKSETEILNAELSEMSFDKRFEANAEELNIAKEELKIQEDEIKNL